MNPLTLAWGALGGRVKLIVAGLFVLSAIGAGMGIYAAIWHAGYEAAADHFNALRLAQQAANEAAVRKASEQQNALADALSAARKESVDALAKLNTAVGAGGKCSDLPAGDRIVQSINAVK